MDDRNLGLEMVRATEAAALSCARYMGLGDAMGADQAAVDAMRRAFDSLHIRGTIVIGEGERDEAPMLYIGEQVGAGWTDGASSEKVDTVSDADGSRSRSANAARAPSRRRASLGQPSSRSTLGA